MVTPIQFDALPESARDELLRNNSDLSAYAGLAFYSDGPVYYFENRESPERGSVYKWYGSAWVRIEWYVWQPLRPAV